MNEITVEFKRPLSAANPLSPAVINLPIDAYERGCVSEGDVVDVDHVNNTISVLIGEVTYEGIPFMYHTDVGYGSYVKAKADLPEADWPTFPDTPADLFKESTRCFTLTAPIPKVLVFSYPYTTSLEEAEGAEQIIKHVAFDIVSDWDESKVSAETLVDSVNRPTYHPVLMVRRLLVTSDWLNQSNYRLCWAYDLLTGETVKILNADGDAWLDVFGVETSEINHWLFTGPTVVTEPVISRGSMSFVLDSTSVGHYATCSNPSRIKQSHISGINILSLEEYPEQVRNLCPDDVTPVWDTIRTWTELTDPHDYYDAESWIGCPCGDSVGGSYTRTYYPNPDNPAYAPLLISTESIPTGYNSYKLGSPRKIGGTPGDYTVVCTRNTGISKTTTFSFLEEIDQLANTYVTTVTTSDGLSITNDEPNVYYYFSPRAINDADLSTAATACGINTLSNSFEVFRVFDDIWDVVKYDNGVFENTYFGTAYLDKLNLASVDDYSGTFTPNAGLTDWFRSISVTPPPTYTALEMELYIMYAPYDIRERTVI